MSLDDLCVNLKNQRKGLVIGAGPIFAFPAPLSVFPTVSVNIVRCFSEGIETSSMALGSPKISYNRQGCEGDVERV